MLVHFGPKRSILVHLGPPTVLWPLLTHHPKNGADSHLASEPVYEPVGPPICCGFASFSHREEAEFTKRGGASLQTLHRANGREGFRSQTAADPLPPCDPQRSLKSRLWVL